MVVLDDKDDGEPFLNGQAEGLVELALPRRGITDEAQHDSRLLAALQAPGRPDGGEALRPGRGRHGEDVEGARRQVARHVPPRRTCGLASEEAARDLSQADAAGVNHRLVAVVGEKIVLRNEMMSQNRECLMARTGDMKKALPLTQQDRLSAVTLPDREHRPHQAGGDRQELRPRKTSRRTIAVIRIRS